MTDADGNEIGKVFIGGLSQATNDDSLRSYFLQFGSIDDCVVMMDNKTGRSRGFGYIKFNEEKTVSKVLESRPHLLNGKIVDVKQCNVHLKGRNRRSLKVFVGGIGLDDNEETIRSFFSQFGSVSDVNLMLDQAKQRHRGFAFVGFEDESVVKDLIARHYVSMNGKHVEIKAMEPPNFARKVLSPESCPNTIIGNSPQTLSGMIVCNQLSADTLDPYEGMVRLQPQYALQPVLWSNQSNPMVNSNATWANPYQFDKMSSSFMYPQQPSSCPNFQQCIPNCNQTMWGVVPPQPTGAWGYQIPLTSSNIHQYPSFSTNSWPYPYLPPYPPPSKPLSTSTIDTSNTEPSQEPDNVVESQIDHLNSRSDEGATFSNCLTSRGHPSNGCWIYNNKDANNASHTNESIMRPDGDDDRRDPYNAPLSDFSFFQQNY